MNVPEKTAATASILKGYACWKEACPDTCCAGWRIGVDDAAFERFEAVGKELVQRVEGEGEDRVKKRDGNRCISLTSEGLCSIHRDYGEAMLPAVCRTFPMVFSREGGSVNQAGVLGCPAVMEGLLDAEAFLWDTDYPDDQYASVLRLSHWIRRSNNPDATAAALLRCDHPKQFEACCTAVPSADPCNALPPPGNAEEDLVRVYQTLLYLADNNASTDRFKRLIQEVEYKINAVGGIDGVRDAYGQMLGQWTRGAPELLRRTLSKFLAAIAAELGFPVNRYCEKFGDDARLVTGRYVFTRQMLFMFAAEISEQALGPDLAERLQILHRCFYGVSNRNVIQAFEACGWSDAVMARSLGHGP